MFKDFLGGSIHTFLRTRQLPPEVFIYDEHRRLPETLTPSFPYRLAPYDQRTRICNDRKYLTSAARS